MSTKVKKKTIKSKKHKKAPLKLSYTDEEKIELKNKYDDILFHLSNFLSEHSVYEAVPENVKILVFSSELSFYEMIKVFIFEDIYCGLIYNPNLNNYLGLITTRDLMFLYKYIIDNFSEERVENFDEYLKYIFSNKKIEKEKNDEDNNEVIDVKINIFQHLKNINYLDYLVYVKNKDLQNINIYSVSLDDNLYETLKKINIKNIHRLLVEDDIKKELRNIEEIKEEKKEKEKIIIRRKDELNNKRVVSNAEKTTSANDSDEEKNNLKIDIKKIMETNKDDIIIERSENTLTKDDIEIEKSKEKIINEEKIESKNNIYKNNKDIKDNIINENLKINELEQNKENEKPKKKKIIKKKKIKSENIKENDLKPGDTQSISSKKRISNIVQGDIPTICKDIITEIKEEDTGKKIIKKKVKKKIVKKKKDINLELPEEVVNKMENGENTHRKMNTNITELNNIENINIDGNIRATTEENQPKTEKKKKIKKKIVKKKSKQVEEKRDDINNKEIQEIKNIGENKDEDNLEENKGINNNIEERNIKFNMEEMLNEEKDNETDNKIKGRKESATSLENIQFKEKMKSYVGIVTNETIFEYLTFNYYSNDMKEFDLSLNELLILGENTFLQPLSNIKDSKEKTYNTFNYYLKENYDIIPIFSENEIEGFIYPKDFLFYIYNCESDRNLTNKEFLENLYKDIDDEKPFGKNRVVYLELNDNSKTLYVKELIEKLNCSIEKKIVLHDLNDINKIYLISLKSIFKAIVEFNLNK